MKGWYDFCPILVLEEGVARMAFSQIIIVDYLGLNLDYLVLK